MQRKQIFTWVLATSLTAAPLPFSMAMAPKALAATNQAPGAPGTPSTWTTGEKDGLGTAFYDPRTGASHSNVWYTLTQGVMSEVYYPDVTRANMQEMQLVVTDGNSFVDFEKTDTTHEVKMPHSNALSYQQINTAKNGKYRIIKTYITDPNQNTVLVNVSFEALVGHVSDYKVYVYSNPSVNNSGTNDSGKVVTQKNHTYLVASETNTALALTASVPFAKATTGYVGQSDGLDQLKKNFQLDTTYSESPTGNIAQLAQLDLTNRGEKKADFTLSLGFGDTEDGAMGAASASLEKPFAEIDAAYRKGWSSYLQTLHKPTVGTESQFHVAAMALKAHEDKLHPGALIASLTIPWGDGVNADQGGVGGYHLIWARDLYEVASSLAAVGDTATAKRALDYLDNVQQKPDGSFPQNSWLDGTPYWGGLQLDEVAFPILLADQLEDTGRYQSLVKPAADFLVQHGPYTPQERWEEEGGYSPSTIAAEIAGLTVAGKMAHDAGDYGSAGVYYAKADEWAKEVNNDTVTQKAPLSPENPYYIRINDTTNADDGHMLDINNGGGSHPKNEVVDAGFLELVRLGIKSPDDPLITNSLNVVDKTIKYDTPYGPTWYRYNFDGYGEKADGSPYDGTGNGRPWPFLSGERGEYEIALSQSAKQSTPNNVYGATNLLQTMAGAANDGKLISEQIWDQAAIPSRNLYPGRGSGSATPLAWAMAQYLRLEESIAEGHVVEMPTTVQQRFLTNPPAAGPVVTVQSPADGATVQDANVTVQGKTVPGTTVVLSTGGSRVVTTADGNGAFTANVKMAGLGANTVDVVSYDNGRSVAETSLHLKYELPSLLTIQDPVGDDNGPGSYTYPTNSVFKKGDFDLQNIRVSSDQQNVYFEMQLGNLDNPWGGPSGLSKQMLDIYVDKDGVSGSGQSWTKDFNAQFRPDAAWEKMIRVSGNWHAEDHVYNSDWTDGGAITVQPNYDTRTITVTVPVSELGGVPQKGWGFSFVLGSEDNGGVRAVNKVGGEYTFGGGTDDGSNSRILDVTLPEGESQADVLDWTKGSPVQLPTTRLQ